MRARREKESRETDKSTDKQTSNKQINKQINIQLLGLLDWEIIAC